MLKHPYRENVAVIFRRPSQFIRVEPDHYTMKKKRRDRGDDRQLQIAVIFFIADFSRNADEENRRDFAINTNLREEDRRAISTDLEKSAEIGRGTST